MQTCKKMLASTELVAKEK